MQLFHISPLTPEMVSKAKGDIIHEHKYLLTKLGKGESYITPQRGLCHQFPLEEEIEIEYLTLPGHFLRVTFAI